jgi:DNA modification methylase
VTQIVLPATTKGFIFACTDKSQKECFERKLFGTSKLYGAAAIRVKKGDFLFLLNLDSDFLYGVFKASSDGQPNIVPEAWDGKYPYQAKVEPIGEIIPLKDAKKLLKKLAVGRASPLGRAATLTILELYRPPNVQINSWYDFLSRTEKNADFRVSTQPKSWEWFGDLKKPKEENGEVIPPLQATTLWDFAKQSYGKIPKGNNKYPGVTPAELIWNLVWRYTEPGDLVVDPMCGSGTTLDVCKEEGRRAICYDIMPPPNRPDITQNDARKIPLPDNYVDLVFVDSPYGDNIRYNDHPDSIGKISSETERFYNELEKVITECHRILKPGKVLGWLIGDQWVKKKFTPVGFLLYQRLLKYFETVDVITVVRRGQASHTSLWFNRARRFNFYLRGFKYLFVMRKPVVGRARVEKPRTITWTHYERNNRKNQE